MGLFNKTEQSTPAYQSPEVLDNINKKVVDDLHQTITKGRRVLIAAASFSIYAFEALKKELNSVDEFRFLFTGETLPKRLHQRKRVSSTFHGLIASALFMVQTSKSDYEMS